MFDLGWISRNDATLFTHTANSYSTLSSGGRHGKDGGDPSGLPDAARHRGNFSIRPGLGLASTLWSTR